MRVRMTAAFPILFACACRSGAPRLEPPNRAFSPAPVRGWRLECGTEEAAQRILDLAVEYGVNRIEIGEALSGGLDRTLADRVTFESVRYLVRYARSRGVPEVVFRSFEISSVPREMIGKDGKVAAGPPLWAELAGRYTALFRGLPELAGIVIDLRGPLLLSDDVRVDRGGVSPADAARILMEAVADACWRAGKDLYIVVPSEPAWIAEAFEKLPPAVRAIAPVNLGRADPSAGPTSRAFGSASRHVVLAEYDLVGADYGAGAVPWCAVDAIVASWRGAARAGAFGAVGVVEWGIRGIFGTPNEVNARALRAVLEDEGADPAQIWKDCTTTVYGESAGPIVAAALGRSYAASTKLFGGAGGNSPPIAERSSLPPVGAALSRYRALEESGRFDPMGVADPAARGRILDARYAGVEASCRRAIEDLRAARPHLSESDFRRLTGAFERLEDTAKLLRAAHGALLEVIALRSLLEKEDPGAEAAAASLSGTIEGLRSLADATEAHFGGDTWPNDPRDLRTFASSLEAVRANLMRQAKAEADAEAAAAKSEKPPK